jgi:hypothetical protein
MYSSSVKGNDDLLQSTRLVETFVPSIQTLFRSTRDQRGNCIPLLATVLLHCILQLAVLVFLPFSRTFNEAGIQENTLSVTTLICHSTRYQRGMTPQL